MTATDRTDAAATGALDIIKMSERGVVFQKIADVEKYLDGSPNPATTLCDIFTRIDLAIQNDESLQEWVSELVEKVSANQQWLHDDETDINKWHDMFPAIVESAKRGRSIRNRRREDVNALVAIGIGGPRFEQLLVSASRNFLNGVRAQVSAHGFSYPLVCCLANVKTYHRLIGKTRGVQKTRQTQPVDLTSLDTVAYRKLSEGELAAANIVIGPAGFIVPSGAVLESPIVDPAFDKAVASFQPGLRGAQQPAEYARAEPKIEDDQEGGKNAPAAKPKKFAVLHGAFLFPQDCTCAEAVGADLKSSIEALKLADGFRPIDRMAKDLLARADTLCMRHCQQVLVNGLGSAELRDKNDLALLRRQLVDDLSALQTYIASKPSVKREYDAFKAALGGFSWAKLSAFAKANGRTSVKRKGVE